MRQARHEKRLIRTGDRIIEAEEADDAHDGDGEVTGTMEDDTGNAMALGEGGGPRIEDVGDNAVRAVGEDEAFNVRLEAAEGGEEFGSDLWGWETGEVFGLFEGVYGGERDCEKVDIEAVRVRKRRAKKFCVGWGGDDGGPCAAGGDENGEVEHRNHVAGG